MTNDILDPAALLPLLPTLLPPSRNHLTSPQDAIAAILHTIFSSLAFRLIGVDDISVTTTDSTNILPEEWNKNGPGHYTFRYRHDQSSLEFVLNVSKLSRRTLINAIANEVCIHVQSCQVAYYEQSDKVASLDIATDDFTSPSFFPHTIDQGGQPLVHGFISSNRVADLTSQIKLKIVQKLIPGLRKEGYTEEEVDTSTHARGSRPPLSSNPSPARPRPYIPPNAPDISGQPFSHIPPQNPFQIGRSDLDPIPSNPFSPPPLFPSSGDGMFVGPDHPIFGPGLRRGPFGDARGPWGGDGFLPPMGAPPGARFDPVGPEPLPDRGGIRGGARGSGGPFAPRRRSGEPDNDEFMPPGMVRPGSRLS